MSFSLLPYLTLLFHLTTMRYFWLGNIERKEVTERTFLWNGYIIDVHSPPILRLENLQHFQNENRAILDKKKNERKGFCRALTPLTRRLYCSECPVNYNKSKLSPYPLLLPVRAKPSTIAQGLPISCSTLAKRLRTSARQDPISTRAIFSGKPSLFS